LLTLFNIPVFGIPGSLTRCRQADNDEPNIPAAQDQKQEDSHKKKEIFLTQRCGFNNQHEK
jgi:hypothetical protein